MCNDVISGFYHLGVVKALWEQGLLPRVISGASAGSIMTAIIGTRSDEDFRQFCTLKVSYYYS